MYFENDLLIDLAEEISDDITSVSFQIPSGRYSIEYACKLLQSLGKAEDTCSQIEFDKIEDYYYLIKNLYDADAGNEPDNGYWLSDESTFLYNSFTFANLGNVSDVTNVTIGMRLVATIDRNSIGL